jgi:hypothetical protein
MGKFALGKTVLSSEVYRWMVANGEFAAFVTGSLKAHARGEWGNISPEDRQTNESALAAGGRLHSAYEHWRLPKIWIITEADRSVTTVLFPEDY